MVESVRAGRVGEDPDLFVGLAGFKNGRAGAVGVDHAVAIMGVGDPRQGLAADDQRPPGIARPKIVVGLDHALHPTRAAKRQVVGDALGVGDLEVLFDPRRQARAEIAATVVGEHVAEIVGENDVVEALGVDAGIRDGLFGRERAEVGGHLVVFRPAPFADLGDLLEFADGLLIVSSIDRLAVVHEKSIVDEIFGRDPAFRDVAAGSNDHAAEHLASRAGLHPLFLRIGESRRRNKATGYRFHGWRQWRKAPACRIQHRPPRKYSAASKDHSRF